eukprot:SM000028S10055  [mRNA]  locus=s28:140582:144993:+ [translate_table: standard]
MDDDGLPTRTSREQRRLEAVVGEIYAALADEPGYLDLSSLTPPPPPPTMAAPLPVVCASRPWVCYWILHSLALLGHRLERRLVDSCAAFLARCQHPEGGFGGGPGQMAHLATTYAAVCALVTIGGGEALAVIDRRGPCSPNLLLGLASRAASETISSPTQHNGCVARAPLSATVVAADDPCVSCARSRPAMAAFLGRMKAPGGGFTIHSLTDTQSILAELSSMHDDGEIDIRGSYTALAVREKSSLGCRLKPWCCFSNQVAHILSITTPDLLRGVGDYLANCQTYEGGMGGEPGNEAHGGYTFCGLAAAILAGEVDKLHLTSLLDWAVFRQGQVEGGFQGRTNKLVDGCYSFWQAIRAGLWQPQESRPSDREVQDGSQGMASSCQNGSVGSRDGAEDDVGPDLWRAKAAAVNEPSVRPASQTAAAEAGEQDNSRGGQVAGSVTDGANGSSAHHNQRGEDTARRAEVSGQGEATNVGCRHDEEASLPRAAAGLAGLGGHHWGTDGPASPDHMSCVIVKAAELFPHVSDRARAGRHKAEILEEGGNDEVGAAEGQDEDGDVDVDDGEDEAWPGFNSRALQAYLLLCSQVIDGGLRDKPGKARDYYHTCYCLSGLSAAQHAESMPHQYSWELDALGVPWPPPPPCAVLGPYSNLLEPAEPLCNVHIVRYQEARDYFLSLGSM